MHCKSCGVAFRGFGRLCKECKRTLSGATAPAKVPAPIDAFKTAPPLSTPAFRKPLSKEGGWARPTLIRTNVMPVAFRGRHLMRTWLAAVGAAGMLATIGEVAFRWGVWWFWLILPSGLALLIGYRLIRDGFFRFADLFNVESDQAGRVYLTTLRGDCPVCDGEVRLKDVGPRSTVKTVILCTKDATHRWAFNPKQLDAL